MIQGGNLLREEEEPHPTTTIVKALTTTTITTALVQATILNHPTANASPTQKEGVFILPKDKKDAPIIDTTTTKTASIRKASVLVLTPTQKTTALVGGVSYPNKAKQTRPVLRTTLV